MRMCVSNRKNISKFQCKASKRSLLRGGGEGIIIPLYAKFKKKDEMMKKFFGSLALLATLANAEGFLANMPSEETEEETQERQEEIQSPQDKAKPSVGKMSKSGFFLGIEGNFGESTLKVKHTFSSGAGFEDGNTLSSHFAFDGGLKLGYQHYFGEKQSLGIRFSAYGGAGVPLKTKTTINGNGNGEKRFFESSYLPIKAGVDLDFLWDFFEKEEHTLGLTLGVGYRFNYYLSLEKTQNVFVTNGTLHENPNLQNINFQNTYLHDFYPQIGLHYYLGHHQFELNYRFGGLIAWLSEPKEAPWFDKKDADISTQIINTDYISLSYVYRF